MLCLNLCIFYVVLNKFKISKQKTLKKGCVFPNHFIFYLIYMYENEFLEMISRV